MRKVDVQGRIMSEASNRVFRWRAFAARGLPEIAIGRLEDTRARTDKVDTTKLGVCNVECASQVTPICDISLYK